MSTLYLVRHGQASFGHSNYDKLSALGERQLRLLGEYWLRGNVTLDAAYVGTLERQIKSAECAREVYAKAGRPFPELRTLPGLNEYDSSAILTGSIPNILRDHPEVAKLVKELAPDGNLDLKGNKKAFQRAFSRIMGLWVEGAFRVKGLESWQEFIGRVNAALAQIMAEQGAGKTVAVFTSGGTISAAMQRALGTADAVSLELGWVIANGSVTEFRYSGEMFSLFSFNTTPHLPEAGLISYR